MFAYNKQVPGPEFHVEEGDWVKVNFKNNTEEMHTIHWHGLVLPYTMDGVPMVTRIHCTQVNHLYINSKRPLLAHGGTIVTGEHHCMLEQECMERLLFIKRTTH
mgnify:CR=1 FL=1